LQNKFADADKAYSVAVEMARKHRPAVAGDYLWNQAQAVLQHALSITKNPREFKPQDLSLATARGRILAAELKKVQQLGGGASDPAKESTLLLAKLSVLENKAVDAYKLLQGLSIPAAPARLGQSDFEALHLRIDVRENLPNLELSLDLLKAGRDDAQSFDRPGIGDERKAEAFRIAAAIAGRLSVTGNLGVATEDQKRLLTNCLLDLAKAIELKHPNSAELRETYANGLLAKVDRHKGTASRQEVAQATAYVQELLKPADGQKISEEAKKRFLLYQSWLADRQKALDGK
jgi:hypothetical protein